MSEHLTRNTEYDEAPAWCQRCQSFTQHRRRPGEKGKGTCANEHTRPKEQRQADRKANANWRQRKLFQEQP